MLSEHIKEMRKFEEVDLDAPITLWDIRMALKWSASGTHLGKEYEDYRLIPIDDYYAEKIYNGYRLVVEEGLLSYVK